MQEVFFELIQVSLGKRPKVCPHNTMELDNKG